MNPARSLTLNNLPFVLSVDCAAQRGAGRDGVPRNRPRGGR